MTTVTECERETFLGALSQGGNVTKAAEASSYARMTWYRLREEDPAFAQAWDDALAEHDSAHRDRVMEELRNRLFTGNVEHKTVKELGTVTREETVTKPSDRILLTELRRLWPDQYGDNAKLTVEHTGTVQQHIEHAISQPVHQLQVFIISLESDPKYRALAPALLPGLKRTWATIEAEAAPAIAQGVDRQAALAEAMERVQAAGADPDR